MNEDSLTLEEAKDYIRVDGNEEDEQIRMFLNSAKHLIKRSVGSEKCDFTKDLVKIATLMIFSYMYTNRMPYSEKDEKLTKAMRHILFSLQLES